LSHATTVSHYVIQRKRAEVSTRSAPRCADRCYRGAGAISHIAGVLCALEWATASREQASAFDRPVVEAIGPSCLTHFVS
jgi:hypothetical protein